MASPPSCSIGTFMKKLMFGTMSRFDRPYFATSSAKFSRQAWRYLVAWPKRTVLLSQEQAPADTADLPAEEPVAADAAVEASAGEEKPAEAIDPVAVEAAQEAAGDRQRADQDPVHDPVPAQGQAGDDPEHHRHHDRGHHLFRERALLEGRQ